MKLLQLTMMTDPDLAEQAITINAEEIKAVQQSTDPRTCATLVHLRSPLFHGPAQMSFFGTNASYEKVTAAWLKALSSK